MEQDLQTFLKESYLTEDEWKNSNFEWEELKKIGTHHQNNFSNLSDVAEFVAKTLQSCPEVHSVRWRIKDTNHLMAKLVRKRVEKNEKYTDLSIENYTEKVTDLVGIRVLHLFKNEWETIDGFIRNRWETVEPVVAYIREGDDREPYENKNCEIEDHPVGYRSIHYIVGASPTKEKVVSEIQVRTLFEEGWSEIDHRVRYPKFSDNRVLSYYLKVFNRMAGSADEMGSFVNELTNNIKTYEQELSKVRVENKKHLEKIDSLINELESEKDISDNMKSKLNSMSKELNKLKPKNHGNFGLSKERSENQTEKPTNSGNFGLADYADMVGHLTDYSNMVDPLTKSLTDYYINNPPSWLGLTREEMAMYDLKQNDDKKK
ncbi:RelA/SpoT domain-containing protein [Hydrogenovibrio thermophilus]|uniref:RelA/SpoT domain-containing protein n=1 Tax=Hydrogenovibrio thermophilus TaxID=265883 RepID=UPI001863AE07|nr:RelA/SpoT domain-containing protein [Hydrogenovibrio thermophilus]